MTISEVGKSWVVVVWVLALLPASLVVMGLLNGDDATTEPWLFFLIALGAAAASIPGLILVAIGTIGRKPTRPKE